MRKNDEISKKNFFEDALEEVNKPLWQKVAEKHYILKRFIALLSVCNVLAGFMFFYRPIWNISESLIFSSIISIIILVILEIVSILSFHYSILSIKQGKMYGYFLAAIAIIILSFNVFSSAEGNKDLINKVAVKQIRLNTLLNDTINRLVISSNELITLAENNYQYSLNALNSDYNSLISDANKDIIISQNGEKDWRKNNEAVKNKASLINTLNESRKQLMNERVTAINEEKKNRDATIERISKELKTSIVETKDDGAKAQLIAYIFGIVLCLLVITMRLIAVLSKIAVYDSLTSKDKSDDYNSKLKLDKKVINNIPEDKKKIQPSNQEMEFLN